MPGRPVERGQRGERDHRGAVRARDDPARQEAHVVGVHLRDHERDVVVHAERGGVVDDARAAVGGPRRPFEREVVVDVDHDEVEAVEAVVAQHLADHLAARERQLAAFRARRRVDAQLVDRERPLLEQPQHLGADEARGPDHADADSGRRCAAHSVSNSKARCSAWTARSTSRSRTTHEMRMVDVEIISMLTFSAYSVSNICAATPGLVRMPAPTSDTRPMPSS